MELSEKLIVRPYPHFVATCCGILYPCWWYVQPRTIKESQQVTHCKYPDRAILVLAPRHQYVVAPLQCPEGHLKGVPKCIGHLFGTGQNVERLHTIPVDLLIVGFLTSDDCIRF